MGQERCAGIKVYASLSITVFIFRSCCCLHSAAGTRVACGEEIRAMRSWVLAASLLAAAATTGAQAADLYDGPPAPRYGSAYEDPRYADIYKYPGPAPYAVPPPRPYGPYAAPPIPRERVYR